jgi:hypothetical protein
MAQVKKDDSVFEELRTKLRGAKDTRVRVGVLESKGGSTGVEGAEISLAELAAIHEYGAPGAGIPARSFLRETFQGSGGREALVNFLAKLAKGVISERVEVEKALDMLGAWAVAAIKNRIKAHIDPPNAPATIAAKGSSTPLVDTGQLINSITWEVGK